MRWMILFIAACWLLGASTAHGITAQEAAKHRRLDDASCVRCHGAERPRAQLRLDTLEGVLKGTKQGVILAAGDSAGSLLVKAVSQLDPETAMPPKPRGPRGPRGAQGTNAPAAPPQGGPGAGGPPPMGGEGDHGPGGPPPGSPGGQRNFGPPAKPLTAEQVGLVRAWIDQGAK